MKEIFVLLLSAALIAVSPVLAQEDTAQPDQTATDIGQSRIEPLEGGMQGRISLDLRNIDIIDALKFLAMKAEISVIATKGVTGKVTLMVEDVVVQDIFDIMLRSNDLAYVKQGDIYNVMTESEYKALFGKNFSDVRQVKTFKLKYAIPEQAFTLLDTLKSDIGRILVEPDSGTVLIMDTPESIKEIEKSLATLEEKNVVRVFDLQYASAKDVEEQLKAQLDAKKVGSIRADERSNKVIVQALSERMSGIEKLITALDTKTKQVLIDTKIVKVKLSDQLDTGVEWDGIFKVGEKLGMTYLGSSPFSVIQAAADAWRDRTQALNDLGGKVGSYPSTGFTTDFSSGSKVSPGENIHIGVVDRQRDFDVILQYLQTLGNTQILSNPKLAVTNGHEASMHVGERQAYVTTTTTTGQTTTTVSEEVTFIDVGIQLAVTPTINDEGYITMKIKPEISSVTSTLTTPSGNKIPIVDTSTAETTVLVKDGSTIILGGMRREDETKAEEQVPFLGDIPLIGFLFSSDTTKVERTELLIVITPYIVGGDILTTGNERDFGYDVGKDYKDYSPFTEEESIIPSEPPEGKIKPYREYKRERDSRND